MLVEELSSFLVPADRRMDRGQVFLIYMDLADHLVQALKYMCNIYGPIVSKLCVLTGAVLHSIIKSLMIRKRTGLYITNLNSTALQ